jgi:hypothetical protein
MNQKDDKEKYIPLSEFLSFPIVIHAFSRKPFQDFEVHEIAKELKINGKYNRFNSFFVKYKNGKIKSMYSKGLA